MNNRVKISFVNPPQPQLNEPYAYPPLGLGYLASMFTDNFDVRIDNLAGEEKIRVGHADFFCVTFPSACKQSVKTVLTYIRENYPKSTVILGGPHPTAKPKETFREYVPDHVVVGEGEYMLPSLVSYPAPEGIYDGGIVKNLDLLPYPRRELMGQDVVVNLTGIHGSKKPSTTIISSRGCPYRCNFCCKCHPMYRVFRDRNPASVVGEIKILKDLYGVQHLRFVDDCFTAKPSLYKLCKALEKVEVTFLCITRTDRLNRGMVRALKKAGCVEVDIGAESLSDKMLKLMNKQLTTQQIRRAIQMVHDEGIDVKIYLMMNYPGETKEDREKGLQFLRETKPERFTLSVFQPLEGSTFNGNSSFFYPDENLEYQQYKRQITGALKT